MAGATNLGFSWAFSEKTSVILGYDIWNNRAVAGKNTFTIQVWHQTCASDDRR